MSDFVLRLVGIDLPCRPRYEETIEYFRAFGEVIDPVSTASTPGISTDTKRSGEISPHVCDPAPVCIPDRDWAEYLAENMLPCAHTEYSLLTPYFSDALLEHGCVIIHAVAMRWGDRAWLICAYSGVGKSTQARFLQELRPDEFSIICGDRPILDFSAVSDLPHSDDTKRENASIIVHPSPWNGKENWHGADAAPLAGIILLERGEKNAIASVSERDAALPIYPHFIHTARLPENICRIADLETSMLSAVPIWKLTTDQAPGSTKLLLESVFSGL